MGNIEAEKTYLIELISDVLHDRQVQDPPENLDWDKLYRLAVHHHISNMAYYGIRQLRGADQPSPELTELFKMDYKKGMAREATQHITVEKVLQIFEDNQIECMPVKGYLLKYLYPSPDMRVMADIDILFKDEKTSKVKDLLIGLGFELKSAVGNQDVYYKKPFMNIEMHRSLVIAESPYYDYFCHVWDRAKLKDGSQCIYELSHEDFFVYVMAHLAKHYMVAGTGIRSIIDIWLYIERYKNEMNWEYTNAELEKIDLMAFTKNICGLGDVWFGGARSNDLYQEMGDFIISGGVYGLSQRAQLVTLINNAGATKNITQGKYRYIMQLLFLKPDNMKIIYPILNKYPFLLPAFWLHRGVKSILFKRDNTIKILNNALSLDGEEAKQLVDFHNKSM